MTKSVPRVVSVEPCQTLIHRAVQRKKKIVTKWHKTLSPKRKYIIIYIEQIKLILWHNPARQIIIITDNFNQSQK